MVMDHNKTFYENLLNNLVEGVCFVDRDRRITFWNAGATRITGLEPHEVLGKACKKSGRSHLDDDGCLMCDGKCLMTKALSSNQPVTAELSMRHRNGERFLVESRVQPVHDEAGNIVGAVEIFLETPGQRSAKSRLAELERLAMHDPLTGIANRRYLDQEIASRMEAYRRNQWSFGILIADIDYFKKINDTYGHIIGDKVLKVVASTLAVNVRPFDLVGRWGGEEFLAILSTSNKTELAQAAERLRVLVEMSWLREQDTEIQITISIGGTLIEPNDTVESLFKRADANIYAAKHTGRNCIRL